MDSNLTRQSFTSCVSAYLTRAGHALSETELTELPGDASDRRYMRVVLLNGSSHLLLVHSEPIDPDTLPFINVAHLLQQMPVPIPEILGCEPDLGILVLEDLGDITLQSHLDRAVCDDRNKLYKDAIALIELMQRRGRDLSSDLYVPFTLSFDQKKLMYELEFFVEHFLVGYCRASLSTDDRVALWKEFRSLAGELSSEAKVFCHRDYHSRNLMLCETQLHVIDFQDARLGPDTYDLVSLLRDSYVDHDQSFVDDMMEYYLGLTGRSNTKEFRRRFNLMAAQRHLKILGTFGYQASTVGTSRYKDDIPRTLAYLRYVFEQHPRFDKLRLLLTPALPELS